MAQTEFDRGLQVPKLVTAVVAFSLEFEGEHGFALHQAGNAVGELNLAARALADSGQIIEDRRGQQIAPYHGQSRRGLRRLWLLDNVRHLADTRRDRSLQGHDSI